MAKYLAADLLETKVQFSEVKSELANFKERFAQMERALQALSIASPGHPCDPVEEAPFSALILTPSIFSGAAIKAEATPKCNGKLTTESGGPSRACTCCRLCLMTVK
jgi:hypothetical protein